MNFCDEPSARSALHPGSQPGVGSSGGSIPPGARLGLLERRPSRSGLFPEELRGLLGVAHPLVPSELSGPARERRDRPHLRPSVVDRPPKGWPSVALRAGDDPADVSPEGRLQPQGNRGHNTPRGSESGYRAPHRSTVSVAGPRLTKGPPICAAPPSRSAPAAAEPAEPPAPAEPQSRRARTFRRRRAPSPQPPALSPQPSALSPQPSALSPQPSALSPQPIMGRGGGAAGGRRPRRRWR